MNINKYLSLLGCAAALTPAAAQTMAANARTTTNASQRPNILFILADDHSRAAVSAYEGINAKLAPTPNIDAIGADGAILQNMLCTNSISGPSRACLLTGKYSTAHGFYQNEGGITFDNTQMQYQKLLRDAGYTTSLFGKWHLYTNPAGFDHYMIHANASQQGTYWDPVYSINGKKQKQNGYATRLTTDAALNWLNNGRDTDKPFCMMLHYKAPHRPWEPDSCYLNLFDEVDFPLPESFDDDYTGRELTLGKNMATIENHLSRGDLKQTPPTGLSPKEQNKWLWWGGSGSNQFWTPDASLQGKELKNWKFQTYLKNYLRVVRSVDDQVGRVVKYLKEHGLYENTIIVYMGDQGFFLGEHGLYDKRWMFEESIQMPCLISYPAAIKRGQKPQQLALNVDIAPTLLDYAGVSIPKEMHGRSMKPLLAADQKAADRKATDKWRKSAYYQYFEYPKWHNVQPHYGVRTDRYKLIHFYYNVDVWELYDLQTDPREVKNQYANPAYASIVKQLKGEIGKLQKECGDTQTLDARRAMTDKYMLKYGDEE